jgi:hypothetical protein
MLTQHNTQASCHDNIIHVGCEDCQNYIPTMEFTGYGKAYVPDQIMCQIYKGDFGFIRGTIFPELDMPYVPFYERGRRP